MQNHREVLAAMDFFTVPTVTFRLLYCFFVIEYERRSPARLFGEGRPTGASANDGPGNAKMLAMARLGGLHHRYTWDLGHGEIIARLADLLVHALATISAGIRLGVARSL